MKCVDEALERLGMYGISFDREPYKITSYDELLRYADLPEELSRVAHSTFTDADGNEVSVSTMFMGCDLARFARLLDREQHAPEFFETMVFGGDLNGRIRRYATWKEAEAGHAETVALMKGSAP
jgi:hypothetical protein